MMKLEEVRKEMFAIQKVKEAGLSIRQMWLLSFNEETRQENDVIKDDLS